MTNDNKNDNNGYDKKTFAFVAIGLIIAGAVALGLSFTVLGVYSLFVSMMLEVVAVSFANYQKKLNDFKWLLYIKIVAYAIFAAAILLFFLK